MTQRAGHSPSSGRAPPWRRATVPLAEALAALADAEGRGRGRGGRRVAAWLGVCRGVAVVPRCRAALRCGSAVPPRWVVPPPVLVLTVLTACRPTKTVAAGTREIVANGWETKQHLHRRRPLPLLLLLLLRPPLSPLPPPLLQRSAPLPTPPYAGGTGLPSPPIPGCSHGRTGGVPAASRRRPGVARGG